MDAIDDTSVLTIAQSFSQFVPVWCCAAPSLVLIGLGAGYWVMRWWADRKDRG